MTTKKPDNGRDKTYCGAKKRQSEGTCRRPAGWGTNHVGVGRCKLHGGSTPDHRKQAQQTIARREAAELGARRDIHPAQALLELVQRKSAEVEYWTGRVQNLNPEELTWSKTKTDMMTGTTREAVPHIALQMMHEAERDLEKFSSASIRAGVQEAMVKAAILQGAAVVEIVRKAVEAARTSTVDADQILLELITPAEG